MKINRMQKLLVITFSLTIILVLNLAADCEKQVLTVHNKTGYYVRIENIDSVLATSHHTINPDKFRDIPPGATVDYNFGSYWIGWGHAGSQYSAEKTFASKAFIRFRNPSDEAYSKELKWEFVPHTLNGYRVDFPQTKASKPKTIFFTLEMQVSGQASCGGLQGRGGDSYYTNYVLTIQ